jgi:hypothetical protein
VIAEPVSTCVKKFLRFLADSSFGYKIKNTTFSFFVSRIPVLNGGVFDLGIVKSD